ncbi:MAG: Ger(x)C family spore germination C-terminal domain-containing protein [Clostridia bacterium]|nr:Ger(x)C family spore germination C-terminal domain-containing protein [Clostridia bacterium]
MQKKGKSGKLTESSEVESKVLVSNVAYFKEEKMEGYLTEDEAKVYNIISNDIKNSIIVTKIEDKDAAFEIVDSKCKTKLDMLDNSFKININAEIKANLSEIKMKIDTNKIENIEKLENALKIKIEEMINSYVDNMVHKYKADISGFGEMLYKKYGNKFEQNSSDYLDRLDFDVEVKVKIENEGSELISR